MGINPLSRDAARAGVISSRFTRCVRYRRNPGAMAVGVAAWLRYVCLLKTNRDILMMQPRQGLELLRCGRSSASAESQEHLHPMRDGCAPHCNTKRRPGHRAGALRPTRRVVEWFATDRSNEPFNVPVLPRRAWRRGAISDPHCANARMYTGPNAPSRSRTR